MRRIGPIVMGAALSLVLAACGQSSSPAPGVNVDSQNGTVTVTGPDGAGATIQSGSAVAAPANLPDFVKLYPGMSINSVMNNTMQGMGAGGMIYGHSADSFDQVVAFYRGHVRSLGFTSNSEMGGQDGLIISTGDDANSRSLAVSIGNAEGGGVDITLQYNSGT